MIGRRSLLKSLAAAVLAPLGARAVSFAQEPKVRTVQAKLVPNTRMMYAGHVLEVGDVVTERDGKAWRCTCDAKPIGIVEQVSCDDETSVIMIMPMVSGTVPWK